MEVNKMKIPTKVTCLSKVRKWSHLGWWIFWLLVFSPALVVMVIWHSCKPFYYRCKVVYDNGDIEVIVYDPEEWDVIKEEVEDIDMSRLEKFGF